MDWDDFRFMQAVARTGSVRAAGELLQVHGSTIARHLDHLEEQVGTRLFARTARGMEITTAGAEVLETLDHVAAQLDLVARTLRARGPGWGGRVTVALPAWLAGTLLVPHVQELLQRDPDIQLRLLTERPQSALHSGDADLALWPTDEPPEDLVGRSLGTVRSCAYASRGLLADFDPAADPQPTRWIGSGDPGSLSAHVRARWFPTLARVLEVADLELRRVALQAGLGVGLLPCVLGDAAPDLARAGDMEPLPEGDLWLLSRPDSRGVRSIQTCSAFLQEVLLQHRPLIEGRSDQEPA